MMNYWGWWKHIEVHGGGPACTGAGGRNLAQQKRRLGDPKAKTPVLSRNDDAHVPGIGKSPNELPWVFGGFILFVPVGK